MRQLPENFFGWNDHKSIMLTKFATLAAAMGCVVMVLCGPRIVSWVLAVHALQLVQRFCRDCGNEAYALEAVPLLCGQCHTPMQTPEPESIRIENFIERHRRTLQGLAER